MPGTCRGWHTRGQGWAVLWGHPGGWGEVFYIKFLQKYSSFNMYITSLLLLERAQYLCLQRKTGPSNVLEHCYKIFLLGRSKEQET